MLMKEFKEWKLAEFIISHTKLYWILFISQTFLSRSNQTTSSDENDEEEYVGQNFSDRFGIKIDSLYSTWRKDGLMLQQLMNKSSSFVKLFQNTTWIGIWEVLIREFTLIFQQIREWTKQQAPPSMQTYITCITTMT